METHDRRAALRLLGAAGAGLVLTACGNNKRMDDAAATTTTASDGSAAARAPEETGGPFPGDGTNGPDVLSDSGVVRSDITTSFGRYSGTASGVPITMHLKVVHAETGEAYAGAAVYLWHCDAKGLYSLYSQGATNQNYLRGVQAADDSGSLTFKSVFPAAYSGRWPHMHYEVYPSVNGISSAKPLLTSQIALPEADCKAVYADAPAYPGSASNLSHTSLQSDMVFADSYQAEMATLTSSPADGYALSFILAV